ncbi:PI-PLC X domain-containing protein At5g67130-like [Prosopis cineraria]|uniref:PI-PLC X domain-containing protein At5g67130-like n=1 Tax=Prosopis cineraria TaxID=364024 RepID=UPI0024101C64|nr:PI-PLC X domain-containing protein At5g67130-like [Prosopis cineraria]
MAPCGMRKTEHWHLLRRLRVFSSHHRQTPSLHLRLALPLTIGLHLVVLVRLGSGKWEAPEFVPSLLSSLASRPELQNRACFLHQPRPSADLKLSSLYCSLRFLKNAQPEDTREEQLCSSCPIKFEGSRCVRSTTSNSFKLLCNDSLPFNRYGYLTTHNSFAIQREEEGPKSNHTVNITELSRVTFSNQEHSITQQLKNGIRSLMLEDNKGDVWLCHSILGKCNLFTAFEPVINALKEVEVFLAGNPSEIVTIMEDHVELPNGLTKVIKASGLMKYWFPFTSMPQDGQNWPLVKDMLAKSHRLIVFTSQKHKQESAGIAYQWNFMVENQCEWHQTKTLPKSNL